MSQESVLTGTRLALREEPKKRSASKRAWRMLRRGRLGLAGCIILFGVIFAAVTAPIIAPHDPTDQDLRARLTCPAYTSCPRFGVAGQTIHGSTTHILGTDNLGRDIFSRIL
jgi:ABC-type dipeptide/oligopeptide/nickel transport system permease subunit